MNSCEIASCDIAVGDKLSVGNHTTSLYCGTLLKDTRSLPVVLKRFHKCNWNSNTRNSVTREVHTLKELSPHKGIVSVFGYCVDETHVSVVMDQKEGAESLQQVVDRRGLSRSDELSILEPYELLAMCISLVDVLAYLSTKNICHGSISPKTILTIGNMAVPSSFVLTGFGHALCSNSNAEQDTSDVVYSPPEAHRLCCGMDDVLTCKSDVWCLGAILLHLGTNCTIDGCTEGNGSEVLIRSKLRAKTWKLETDLNPKLDQSNRLWTQQQRVVQHVIASSLVSEQNLRLDMSQLLCSELYAASLQLADELGQRYKQVCEQSDILQNDKKGLLEQVNLLNGLVNTKDANIGALTIKETELRNSISIEQEEIAVLRQQIANKDDVITDKMKANQELASSIQKTQQAFTQLETVTTAKVTGLIVELSEIKKTLQDHRETTTTVTDSLKLIITAKDALLATDQATVAKLTADLVASNTLLKANVANNEQQVKDNLAMITEKNAEIENLRAAILERDKLIEGLLKPVVNVSKSETKYKLIMDLTEPPVAGPPVTEPPVTEVPVSTDKTRKNRKKKRYYYGKS